MTTTGVHFKQTRRNRAALVAERDALREALQRLLEQYKAHMCHEGPSYARAIALLALDPL